MSKIEYEESREVMWEIMWKNEACEELTRR